MAYMCVYIFILHIHVLFTGVSENNKKYTVPKKKLGASGDFRI